MFIVLRRKQLKRHLCIALFLIFTGMALSNPFVAKADNNLMYLYPYITNNPVEKSGLFWLESHPELGAYKLSVWQEVLKNKQIVIGIPEERFTMGASIVGDNLGNYIVHKLKKKLSGNSQKEPTPPPPGKYDKDKFSYKRTINGNSEEISVEVGKHFENNEKWKEFMDVVKDHLTDNELLKQPIPEPKDIPDSDNESAKMIGNTMALGGLALLIRVLIIAVAL